MSPKQAQINLLMQEAKKKLLARRAQLLKTLTRRNDVRLEVSSFSTPTAENGERALGVSFIFSHTEQVACLENQLKAVETALTRTDLGTWGLCEKCGKAISYERLEASPEAALCLVCSGCGAVCSVVILEVPWGSKGHTIDILQRLGISREKARKLLAKVPTRIVEWVTEAEAKSVADKLREAGALVLVLNERAKVRASEHRHDEEVS